jgi:hypothetical protein
MKCPITLLVMTRSLRVKTGNVGSSVPESSYWLEWHSTSPRAWMVVNLWVGLLVKEVHAKPLSHAGDGVIEPMLVVHDVAVKSCWRWHCRVNVGLGVMSLLSRCWWWHCRVIIGHGVTSLPSHAGDGAVKSGERPVKFSLGNPHPALGALLRLCDSCTFD